MKEKTGKYKKKRRIWYSEEYEEDGGTFVRDIPAQSHGGPPDNYSCQNVPAETAITTLKCTITNITPPWSFHCSCECFDEV